MVTSINDVQIREVASGSSQMSQNMLPIHFGLANSKKVDIEIFWPSGTLQELKNISSNQILTVREPT